MTDVQIFGATGAVGCRLLARVGAIASSVQAVTRRAGAIGRSAELDGKFDWRSFDLRKDRAPTSARQIISAGPLDAFAQWLQEVEATDLTTVVAVSSMSVESKRNAIDAGERAMALRILEAEARLIECCERRNIQWTILRPTLIWGAGMDRSLTMLYQFARRCRVAPMPMSVGGLRQPVHADDVARACLSSLSSDAASNQIIPIGGGEVLPVSTMWRRVIETAAARPLPLPLSALLLATRFFRTHGPAMRTSWQRWNQDQIAPEHPALKSMMPNRRSFLPAPEHFRLPLDWRQGSSE